MTVKRNNLTITGIKEIDRKLKGIPDKLAKKALRQSMRPAMKEVLKEAQQNAPVDSGDLKKSIKLKAGPRSKKAITLDVAVGEGFFKGDTFYAGFVEFGTSKMPAKPFMRPAYDSKGQDAKNKVIQDIPKMLEDVVKKAK